MTSLLSNKYDSKLLVEALKENSKLNTMLKIQLLEEVKDNCKDLSVLKRGNEAILGEVLNSYIPAEEIIAFARTGYTIEDFNYKFHKALATFIGHHEFKELIQEYLMIFYCKLNPSFQGYYLQWFEHKQEGVII